MHSGSRVCHVTDLKIDSQPLKISIRIVASYYKSKNFTRSETDSLNNFSQSPSFRSLALSYLYFPPSSEVIFKTRSNKAAIISPNFSKLFQENKSTLQNLFYIGRRQKNIAKPYITLKGHKGTSQKQHRHGFHSYRRASIGHPYPHNYLPPRSRQHRF